MWQQEIAFRCRRIINYQRLYTPWQQKVPELRNSLRREPNNSFGMRRELSHLTIGSGKSAIVSFGVGGVNSRHRYGCWQNVNCPELNFLAQQQIRSVPSTGQAGIMIAGDSVPFDGVRDFLRRCCGAISHALWQ